MSNNKNNIKKHLPFLIILILGTLYAINRRQSSPEFQQESGSIFGTVYHVTYQCDSSLKAEIEQEMKSYATLDEWLEHVKEDRIRQRELQSDIKKVQTEGVQLLTMHASKGLEFDTVYLLDVNKGKVPKGSKFTKEELEEERRLFYVAMTRAKKQLNIYYIRGMKDHTLQPSVFIEPLMRTRQ